MAYIDDSKRELKVKGQHVCTNMCTYTPTLQAKPTQRWLYDVASSGYFGGLVMVTTAILGAGYVVASLGIGKHKSCAGRMPFDCGHPLVFVKTISSVGGGGGVVSGGSCC